MPSTTLLALSGQPRIDAKPRKELPAVEMKCVPGQRVGASIRVQQKLLHERDTYHGQAALL
ncbi:hypothetical protein AWC22_13660 [Mycobacterium riyadhense]|uniref:Uncharacterized protein n=1 Tax=Mycobacterium riyadhense TaxID=486698 RepID=A0A1X2D7X8_9MYCO|nr:hypothetical protein AWC22_13660 [Mycobacterium riyadhense]VTP00881.1 hypothetical protein BIN_B_03800 [Mycobacterium riyadhense]